MAFRQLIGFILLCLLGAQSPRLAASESTPDPLPAAVATLGLGSASDVREAVAALSSSSDPRALALLSELAEGRLQVDQAAGVYRSTADGWRHVLSGAPPPVDAELVAPSLTNALRRQLGAVRAQMQITSPDASQRLAGARAMAEKLTPEADAALRAALEKESDVSVRRWLGLAVAQLDLQSPDPDVRLKAVTVLGQAGRLSDRALIAPLASDAKIDGSVRAAAVQALNRIDRHQWWANQAANLFYGLSLGSILLLSALGLAITFGLMGVINMAHGEMLMLGAYTTYVVQRVFQSLWPIWQDGYLFAAIPAAFVVTA